MSTPRAEAGVSPSLWRNPSFLRLWLAQVVSSAGSRVSDLALPLTAVTALGATPAEMGLLGVAGSLPNLLFGLFAGVWVDRIRRRPIMVGADLGRVLLLGSIPIAALLGNLTFLHLYLVGFAAGLLSILFTIASVAVLPSVVSREQLVDANGKFATSDSVLSIAGPSAAGGLVQLLTAPIAVVADAVSYVLSALLLRGVGESDQPPSQASRRNALVEIGDGIRELVRTPLLRALTLSASVGILGLTVQSTVMLIFFTRKLGLNPTIIGFVYATGGVASLAAATLASRFARVVGTGPAVIVGQGLWTLGSMFPILAGLVGPAVVLLVGGQVVAQTGATIWSINQMSLRQHLTPVQMLGRVTAARRFFMLGMAPIGAALGGALGVEVGLRQTLAIGAVGPVLALLLVFFSPVHDVRELSGELPDRGPGEKIESG